MAGEDEVDRGDGCGLVCATRSARFALATLPIVSLHEDLRSDQVCRHGPAVQLFWHHRRGVNLFLDLYAQAQVTTMEARVGMLQNIFRQEIGYHDNPENTPGRLVAALKIYAYRVSRLIVTFGDKVDALCSVVVGRLRLSCPC